MSKLIAAIACTRPNLVGRMVASLDECDEVRIGMDATRAGQAVTRNSLLTGLADDDVVVFCDDDDTAINTRLLWQEFSTHADALLFSYQINGRLVTVPSDPWLAAADHVISCNWMIRGRLINGSLRGVVFDPTKTVNTGTWAWLRILGATARIQVEPAICGYLYHQGWQPDGASRLAATDPDLFDELRNRVGNVPGAMAAIEARAHRVGSRVSWR